jgi:hypothetical protein
LHEPFVRRNKEADDAEPDGDDEQRADDAIESLPDGSFVPLTKIYVIHLSAA